MPFIVSLGVAVLKDLFANLCRIPQWVWIALATLAAFVFLFWYSNHALNAAYARGVAETTARYERQAQDERTQAAQAQFVQLAQSKAVNLQLSADLAKEKARTAQLAKQKVTDYVSPRADRNCSIPVGFVYLHDLSLDPGDGSVAGSRPADVDAPTGLTLSQVADADRFNLSEARERGKVIEAWQTWYAKNKEFFEQTIAGTSVPPPMPPGLQSIAN